MTLCGVYYFILNITITNITIRTNRKIERYRTFLIVQYFFRSFDLYLKMSWYSI